MGHTPTEKVIQYFYRHNSWLTVRKSVLERDNYIDHYELIDNDRISPENTVHHIIPLRECWDFRSNIRNFEVISRSNHNGGSVVREKYESTKRNAKLVLVVKVKKNDELL